MLKIVCVHPDVISPQRIQVGQPRLNAEWLELFNASAESVDAHGFYVTNSRQDNFTIALPRRATVIVGPYESILVFSGHPDRVYDPALCYLSNQTLRVFLKRNSYLWNACEDAAYLYKSHEAFLANPKSTLDRFFYKRRPAKAILAHQPPKKG